MCNHRRRGIAVDLFEYQARDLFEKHGVPVLAGKIADDARRRRAPRPRRSAPRAAASPSSRRRSRPAAAARPAASRSPRPPTRREQPPSSILGHGHQGPHGHARDGRRRARRSPRSTTSPSCSTGPTAPTSRCAATRAAWRSRQLAVERPEALAKVAVDPQRRHRRGQGHARSSTPAGFAAETAAKVAPVLQKLWDGLPRRGRHPGRGQPAGADRRTARSSRSTARSPSTTTPTSATRTTPSSTTRTPTDPLEAKAKAKDLNYVKLDGKVGIIGNGAGLVMSTLDVVAYAGENARRRASPANFLDIGGGASRRGDGQRPRRHPATTRRSRASSSTSSAASPPATRSPTASSAR